uniref:Secreted protein n=1 Tax=Brugia timori TaxID=42155 RepID=A0A0R3QD71_9BILA
LLVMFSSLLLHIRIRRNDRIRTIHLTVRTSDSLVILHTLMR